MWIISKQIVYTRVNSHNNNFFDFKNRKSLLSWRKKRDFIASWERERDECVSSYCFQARKFAPLDALGLHARERVRFLATLYSRWFGYIWLRVGFLTRRSTRRENWHWYSFESSLNSNNYEVWIWYRIFI